MEDYIDWKKSRIPVSKQLAKTAKFDLLVSGDHNGLHPSAMAHLDSKCPKIETGKAFNIEDGDRLCSLFYNCSWKSLNNSNTLK